MRQIAALSLAQGQIGPVFQLGRHEIGMLDDRPVHFVEDVQRAVGAEDRKKTRPEPVVRSRRQNSTPSRLAWTGVGLGVRISDARDWHVGSTGEVPLLKILGQQLQRLDVDRKASVDGEAGRMQVRVVQVLLIG